MKQHNDCVSNASGSRSRPWHRLFTIANQLRYGLVLLVLLSLLPTGGLLIYLSFQAQLQQSRSLQQERSQAAAGQINNYLDDLKRKLSYLARVKGLTTFHPHEQQSLLEGLTRHNDAYEAVAILNRYGQVVASVSPYEPLQLENSATSPLFIRAFKQQEDYISPVELNPQTHQMTTIVAVPIRNEQDEVDGVLLARVNLDFLWFIVSQTDVGKTGYVYIVDERNYLIAEKGSKPETLQLQNLSDRPFFQALQTSESSKQLNVYQGLKQIKVLGATALIRSVNWLVVVEQPTAEAYAPIYQMLSIMGGALVIVTIGALGAGFLFIRQIIVPLQRLTTAATELSTGHLETRVNIHSQNELGTLAIAFNDMATRLERSIKAAEVERNFVSAILETAGALVVVLDPQGRIVRLNRACEQITHYSFSELNGRYIWELLLSDSIEQAKIAFQALQVRQFPQEYEGSWVTKEQQIRSIAWSDTVLLDEQGNIEYIIKTGIDITERKQAEEELRASEQRLSLLFRQSSLAVVEWNVNYEVVAWNLAAEQIFGYTANEAIGRNATELVVSKADQDQANRVMKDLLVHMGGTHSINKNRTKDGRTIICEWYNTPLVSEVGEIVGVASLASDITAREESEANLKQAKEEAEAALQSLQQTQAQLIQAEKMSGLGQLVAGVAHEINNPVNFIYGNLSHTAEYTQDLLELVKLYQKTYPVTAPHLEKKIADIDLDFMIEDLPKILSSMKIGADRIRQIVLSLRNFSRLDEAEMKPVDIHEGIDSTLMILQSRLKAKADRPAIEVVKEYGDLPPVECYAGQLNQVFMNILSNSIDALESCDKRSSAKDSSAHPNRITIRTKLIANKSHSKYVKSVVIQIQDNGPGMTQHVKQQLFVPFFTTKPTGQGTGLGLSISYQIVVDKHGGSLHCFSQPGEGAEFWIEIPVSQSNIMAVTG